VIGGEGNRRPFKPLRQFKPCGGSRFKGSKNKDDSFSTAIGLIVKIDSGG
jgi:hypothetical protein